MVTPTLSRPLLFGMGASFLVMLVRLSLPASAFVQVQDHEAAKRGKLVFENYGCFVCHGNEGSGGVKNRNSATGGAVPALTYTSRAFRDADLKERITRGGTPVKKADPRASTPPLSMPFFKGLIADAELNDLVAYLRSLTPAEGEPPKPVSEERPSVPAYMLASNNCQICHSIVTENFKTNLHYGAHVTRPGDSQAIVCTTCHGDGRNHAARYGDPEAIVRFSRQASTSPQEKNAACLQCHEKGIRLYWKASTHESKSVACVDCHKIMEPASPQRLFAKPTEFETCFQCHQQRRAQMQRSSHMPFREGKLKCSDCHNPHGTANDKLLTESTVHEDCYKYHADKRGAFLC